MLIQPNLTPWAVCGILTPEKPGAFGRPSTLPNEPHPETHTLNQAREGRSLNLVPDLNCNKTMTITTQAAVAQKTSTKMGQTLRFAPPVVTLSHTHVYISKKKKKRSRAAVRLSKLFSRLKGAFPTQPSRFKLTWFASDLTPVRTWK